MLNIIIPSTEIWDGEQKVFLYTKEFSINLEHSLVSISKWEAKWHKPFISDSQKTQEETIDYIKCMTITQNIPEEAYKYLTKENIDKVHDYIKDGRSATWFTERPNPNAQVVKKKEVITSELIYYWMIALEIPFECQKWHLNRLLTLIRVCNIKNNNKPKKMGKKETLRNNAKINAARRAQLNTSG